MAKKESNLCVIDIPIDIPIAGSSPARVLFAGPQINKAPLGRCGPSRRGTDDQLLVRDT